MAQGVERCRADVLARLESGPRTLRQLAILLGVSEEVVHEPVTELCSCRLVERQGRWYVLTAEGRELF
jgi:predicted transcriptional regulator